MHIQDLHAHTWYSDCGRDDPRLVIETALQGGIHSLGICDHNYGIGKRKETYFQELETLSCEFGEKITLLKGIEIATINGLCLLPDEDISRADFCLVEHLDHPESCVGADIVSFARRCNTRTGIAHTDLFAMMASLGETPEKFLRHLAQNGIFWEMNVNFDSIHHYREHDYVKRFCHNAAQQELVRQSGLQISVGFDGHRVEDYQPQRVIDMCRFLSKIGISQPFEN